MKVHSFFVSQPRLVNHRDLRQGAPVSQFEISIPDVREAEAPPALVVNYRPREDDDPVTLRRYGSQLFAESDGYDFWYHGPRRCIGASPETVQALATGEAVSVFRSLVSVGKSQYRNRRGRILGDDRPGEIAAKAEAFLFVDGRLHRAVKEPVWEVSYLSYQDPPFTCIELSRCVAHSSRPSLTVRFDRPDVAEALARLRFGKKRRDCQFVAPVGSVDVVDSTYEPSFDVFKAMAVAYGEDVLRRIEPVLPNLDHSCAVDFAMMAEGVAKLDQLGHVAALQFCDGFYDFACRLAADRCSVPSDLKHWLKGKMIDLLPRIEIARAYEADVLATPRP